ncbi:MAG: ribokinase [Phycisphaerae bacterium]|nr:ribokinase [Phycisphaerae bacterium]
MMIEPSILVIGSANMDMVVRAAGFPLPGQTVFGSDFQASPGGKGANQAVAVARLGGMCRFLGRVGDDSFGRSLKQSIAAEGVNVDNLMLTENIPTGTAIVVVDSSGENSIIVSSGANFALTPDDIYGNESLFEHSAVVLIQLEIPLPTVRAAIDLSHRHGVRIILDPTPVPKCFPPEMYRVDIISPNAVEAEALTGKKLVEERIAKQVAMQFIEKGAKSAVVKLGARGSLVVMSDGHFYHVPPFKVDVLDSTGAGDAFTAGLGVAYTKGMSLREAAVFANAAGALACTKLGAQAALPTALDVQMLMRDQKK